MTFKLKDWWPAVGGGGALVVAGMLDIDGQGELSKWIKLKKACVLL